MCTREQWRGCLFIHGPEVLRVHVVVCAHVCACGVVVCVVPYICVCTYFSDIISIAECFLYLSFGLLTTL